MMVGLGQAALEEKLMETRNLILRHAEVLGTHAMNNLLHYPYHMKT